MKSDASPSELAKLFGQTSLDDFFANYWERKPLLIRGSHEIAFSFADLDSMLVQMQFRAGNIRIVGDGSDHTPADPQAEVSVRQIQDAFSGGKSIVIRECHRYLPALRELIHGLESELTHAIMANLYVTPPGQRAFARHIDTHDVIVLQLDGCKRWRLFGTETDLPLEDASTEPKEGVELTLEADLAAGDVLYVPRGFAHEVVSVDSWSVHATVGIYVFRWSDLIVEAIRAKAISDVELRRSISIPASRSIDQENQLLDVLRTALTEADLVEAWTRLRDGFRVWTKNSSMEELPEFRDVD